jgi:hypothetical protein
MPYELLIYISQGNPDRHLSDEGEFSHPEQLRQANLMQVTLKGLALLLSNQWKVKRLLNRFSTRVRRDLLDLTIR